MTTLQEAAQMALDCIVSNQVPAAAQVKEALRAALANEFNPDWDAMAVMVEEQQRMAKRIEELEAELAQPEQEPQEDYSSEIANLLPNCAVVRLDDKSFLVQPKTKESKEQWETRLKQIDGYFAVSQEVSTQPEQEPVTTLFGSLPVYDLQTKQKPVAWVETLENARPHCVTDLNYLSVAQHERGEHLKYIPLYIDPTPCQTCEALARTVMMDQTSHDTPQREWQGLTDEEYEAMAEDYVTNCYFDTLKYARAIEAKLREMNGG